MIYFLISFAIFIGVSVIHIFLCRKISQKFRNNASFLGVFLIGLVLYICTAFAFSISLLPNNWLLIVPIPISGSIFYLLLVLLYFIYYLSTFSGEVSPSVKLYLLMKDGKKKTQKEIIHSYQNNELVGSRIQTMISSELIRYQNGRYKILPKGKKLANISLWYRSFLGWKSSG